ncbi:MAG: methyltransferase domain-containing protein [Candidatus Limnocylindrales bacterium]
MAAAAAVVTVSWNAVRLSSSVTLSDAFLLVAAAVLVSAGVTGRLTSLGLTGRLSVSSVPMWLPISGALLLVAGVLSALSSADVKGNLAPAVAFVIALTFVPLIVGLATGTSRLIRTFALLLLVSSAISGGEAVADLVSGAGISTAISGAAFLGRSAGLSVHPNHMALAAAMGLPLAYGLLVTSRRRAEQTFVYLLLLPVTGGIFASGSRAGLVCAVGGVATAWFLSRGEYKRWRVAVVMFAIGLLVLIVSSAMGWHQLTVATDRLVGLQPTTESNSIRVADYTQAVASISSNPLVGTGFSSVRIAHNIYLQVLEAGGVLGITAFAIFGIGFLYLGLRLCRDMRLPAEMEAFAAAATASMLTWFAGGLVGNQIYDRYLYVPCGLLVGIALMARSSSASRIGAVIGKEWMRDPRIEEHLVGGALAVDLGCGGGEWADAAMGRYDRVVGIDVSLDRLERRTHPKGGWEFVQADLNNGIPLPDACADGVHADQVIEYVANPLQFVLEAYRVLRPGGVLVLATPNVRDMRHVIRLVAGGHGSITSGEVPRTPEAWDEGRVHFLSSRDLERLARTAGFSSIQTEALIDTSGSMRPLRRLLNSARRRGLVKGLLCGKLMLAATK